MAKTATTTATRSLAEIVDEFTHITDSGALRLHQSRLTYEYVGATEGAEATELKTKFATEANVALKRANEAPLTVPGVTNLVNTWSYMKRANVVTDPDVNEKAPAIAKAAFNLASQTFRGKDKDYVNPAIEAIANGMDAEKAFIKAKDELKAAKAADNEKKAREAKAKENDPNVVFDSIVATLGMITKENASSWSAEQKSTLRDLIAASATVVK
jgi:hypothetical protein